jgi:hypothetical protein
MKLNLNIRNKPNTRFEGLRACRLLDRSSIRLPARDAYCCLNLLHPANWLRQHCTLNCLTASCWNLAARVCKDSTPMMHRMQIEIQTLSLNHSRLTPAALPNSPCACSGVPLGPAAQAPLVNQFPHERTDLTHEHAGLRSCPH